MNLYKSQVFHYILAILLALLVLATIKQYNHCNYSSSINTASNSILIQSQYETQTNHHNPHVRSILSEGGSSPSTFSTPEANYTWSVVEDTYIITFTEYQMHQQHELYLTSILGPSKPSVSEQDSSSPHPYSWMNIPRDNPAQHYPTDFLLIQLLHMQLHSDKQTIHNIEDSITHTIQLLESDSHIKHVTKQRKIQRTLLSIEEATEAEEYKAEVGDFRIPPRFSSYSGFSIETEDDKETNYILDNTSNTTKPNFPARKLCDSPGASAGDSVAKKYGAQALWDLGYSGRGITVAIFDTGLAADHSHFRRIKDRSNWTDEKQLDDGLGHGTFVAGVIASEFSECLGFAPDAELHIFRVFNQKQLSFTSWFLDAFNYAIQSRVNILNLSIGGPDFLDSPFVDKVQEMSANSIIVVSAIGNDGPLYGTLNNPADQVDVIGVGGLDSDDKSIASFSSRGMTTWELPSGYGRVKPDIIALAKSIRGSKIHGGCRSLSGTSVASPVVAGAVTLLASTLLNNDGGGGNNNDKRRQLLNPATMKQILVESAQPIPNANIFEQGTGKLNLLGAFNQLKQFQPHASVIPHEIDLTDCPYFWPYCKQELYYSQQPVIVNFTLLNSMSVSGYIEQTPIFRPDNTESDIINMRFESSDTIWPWSSYLAAFITIKTPLKSTVTVTGVITFSVLSSTNLASTITIPVKLKAIETPSRNQRVLFDSFHNLRYPSGYFPRDNLEIKSDTLDWNGDHLHTNYKELYEFMRNKGYYIEVLGNDYTCFDALNYGTLLIIDTEDEFYPEEIIKLKEDILERGLSIIVLAEWYNQQVMREIKFYDENTASWWTPETGGANVPALNQLLHDFGISFSDFAVKGNFNLNHEEIHYASGTTIAKFPADSYLFHTYLSDSGSGAAGKTYPILGIHQTRTTANTSQKNSGRIAVYGDSNCIDMNHRSTAPCVNLFHTLLQYTAQNTVNSAVFPDSLKLTKSYHDDSVKQLPVRMIGNNLIKYSHTINPKSPPSCASREGFSRITGNQEERHVDLDWPGSNLNRKADNTDNNNNNNNNDDVPQDATLRRTIPDTVKATEGSSSNPSESIINDANTVPPTIPPVTRPDSDDFEKSHHVRGNPQADIYAQSKRAKDKIKEQQQQTEHQEQEEEENNQSLDTDSDSLIERDSSSWFWYCLICLVIFLVCFWYRRDIPILNRIIMRYSGRNNYGALNTKRGRERFVASNNNSSASPLSVLSQGTLQYRERIDRESSGNSPAIKI